MSNRGVANDFYNFNPRSYEGATKHVLKLPNLNEISIHAPTKERHYREELTDNLSDISIHAPTKERRYIDFAKLWIVIFQSTLLRRSDCKIAQKSPLSSHSY